jgi:hypothetical protein
VHAQPTDDAALRERVLAAIDRAQGFLISQQLGDGSWQPNLSRWRVGVSSLAVLALLNSGLPTDHPKVARGLEFLRSTELPDETYELSTMILALAATGEKRDVGRIGQLADLLVQYQQRDGEGRGAWGYGGGGGPAGWWDNSNTQFALLGLREAAYAGIPIDDRVWQDAQDHWMKQRDNLPIAARLTPRGWEYNSGREATGSMTVAGVASLTITSGFLRSRNGEGADGSIDCCALDDEDGKVRRAIDAGVLWLTQHFRVTSNPGEDNWLLYYIYGLERAGRLTGLRFFGDHDWYRVGARHLVESQDVRFGSWTSQGDDPVSGTCFALLFLSKGLSPVLINKLKFGSPHPDTGAADRDFWNVHPRDINNLTEHISGREKWPRLVTWQVLDLKLATETEGVAALLQAPVQYLCGSEDPDVMSDSEVALLREYIMQGGFLFAVQGCGRADFEDGFRRLVKRMFPEPEYDLQRLPDTHDIYRSEHLLDGKSYELWGVDIGCRTAIVYAPFDHACRWDRWMKYDPPRRPVEVKSQISKSINIGVNVIAYATGRELADKLKTPSLVKLNEDDPLNRGRTVIARLRHTGGFDTAPNALKHVRLALEEIGIDLSPLAPTIPAGDPTLFDYPLLYMHGRKNFALTAAERDQLQAYLENGGFLFADACCGIRQFDASFRKLVEQIFGQPLTPIPIEHELFHNPLGYDIREVRRRIPEREGANVLVQQESKGAPIVEGIEVNGRYVVVYSKYDLSCALERQTTVSCAGYPTEDAARIAVNIVLYGLYQ